MTRAEFLAERQTGIGGSDAAALLNVGWGCWRKLAMQKRGVEPDYEPEPTNAMRRGTRMEPLIVEEYRQATGRTVISYFSEPAGSYGLGASRRHPDHGELIVHIDGFVCQPDMPLECKCIAREPFQKYKREGLPIDYILQLQWAMMVTGLKLGSFAVFWADGWELLWWDVEYDPYIGENLKQQGIEFWQMFVDRISAMVELDCLPPRLEPTDRRCQRCEYRRSCQGDALLEAFRKDNPNAKEVPAIEELAPLLYSLASARELAAEAKENADAAKAALEAEMKARGVTAFEACGLRAVQSVYPVKEYVVKASVRSQLRIYSA